MLSLSLSFGTCHHEKEQKKKTFRVVPPGRRFPSRSTICDTYTAFLFPAEKTYFSAGRRRLIHSPGNQIMKGASRTENRDPDSNAGVPQSWGRKTSGFNPLYCSWNTDPEHKPRRNRNRTQNGRPTKDPEFFFSAVKKRTERDDDDDTELHTSRWRRNFLPSFFPFAFPCPHCFPPRLALGATRRRKERNTKRKESHATVKSGALC